MLVLYYFTRLFGNILYKIHLTFIYMFSLFFPCDFCSWISLVIRFLTFSWLRLFSGFLSWIFGSLFLFIYGFDQCTDRGDRMRALLGDRGRGGCRRQGCECWSCCWGWARWRQRRVLWRARGKGQRSLWLHLAHLLPGQEVRWRGSLRAAWSDL